MKLSETDHKGMENLLNRIFDEEANGGLTRAQAVSAIVHVMAAITRENELEVRAWIGKPETLNNYKDVIRAAGA